MVKVMLFIDGTWLYRSREILRDKVKDPNLTIDYGKLPHVLADELAKSLQAEVDLVRTHFFASIPANVDPRDLKHVEEQRDFYDRLKEDYHYETDIYDIDFRKRRYHKKDRVPKDSFVPEEKCVDIALASSMLYYAALPYGYDAAIPVIGDEDYVPVLRHVRRLAKRTMIASIHGSCDDVYDPVRNPTDSRRVRDVDTVFLDEIIGDLLLEFPLQGLECESPLHKGDRKVWTREQPRKSRPYYCKECREEYARQRAEADNVLGAEYPEELLAKVLDNYRPGRINKPVSDRGFGFIRCINGKDWFFHASNVKGAEFSSLSEFQCVQFIPKTEPGPDNNYRGDVYEVRILEQ
jgi:cold shock CspA family protein/uncharacterized LabA/DUF88 family protein